MALSKKNLKSLPPWSPSPILFYIIRNFHPHRYLKECFFLFLRHMNGIMDEWSSLVEAVDDQNQYNNFVYGSFQELESAFKSFKDESGTKWRHFASSYAFGKFTTKVGLSRNNSQFLTVSFLLYAPQNQTDLNNIYSYDVIGQPVSQLSTRSFRRHYVLICEVKQRLPL